MSASPPRAVFDCVVFIQALIANRGPAAECIARVQAGEIALQISDDILVELAEVATRPKLTQKYPQLTATRVAAFTANLLRHAALLPAPPKAFALPRDPDDEIYLNLAIAADAPYLVTWNERHLTYLMKGDTPEGVEFCRRYPNLAILDPPGLLATLPAMP